MKQKLEPMFPTMITSRMTYRSTDPGSANDLAPPQVSYTVAYQ